MRQHEIDARRVELEAELRELFEIEARLHYKMCKPLSKQQIAFLKNVAEPTVANAIASGEIKRLPGNKHLCEYASALAFIHRTRSAGQLRRKEYERKHNPESYEKQISNLVGVQRKRRAMR